MANVVKVLLSLLLFTGCAHSCPTYFCQDDNTDQGAEIKIAYITGWEDHGRQADDLLEAACAWKTAFEMMRDDRDRWLDFIYEKSWQNYQEAGADVDYEIKFVVNGYQVQCD